MTQCGRLGIASGRIAGDQTSSGGAVGDLSDQDEGTSRLLSIRINIWILFSDTDTELVRVFHRKTFVVCTYGQTKATSTHGIEVPSI